MSPSDCRALQLLPLPPPQKWGYCECARESRGWSAQFVGLDLGGPAPAPGEPVVVAADLPAASSGGDAGDIALACRREEDPGVDGVSTGAEEV